MNRVIALLVLSWLVCACGADEVEAEVDYFSAYRSAASAYQAGDFGAFRTAVRQALALRPDYPPMLYNLAIAESQLNNPGGAVALLERLAAMGLHHEAAADEDFAALQEMPTFQVVAKQLHRNGLPAGQAQTVFSLHHVDFIPEGIAYDPRSGRYFIGSIRSGRIEMLQPGRQRHSQVFAEAAAGGPWSVFGMRVDTQTRRLLVASSAVGQLENVQPEDRGRTAIFFYALDSGELLARHDFPADGTEHVLGDLVQHPDGGIYTTDSLGGGLYRLDPENGTYETMIAPETFVSPQGLDIARDGSALYLADYRGPVYRFEPTTRELKPLACPDDVSLYGIDGLYRYGDSLVGIQNGVQPHRVIRLRLTEDGKRVRAAEVLVAAQPAFDEPTLGVIVDGELHFVANSQWGRFDANNQLAPLETLRAPLILSVSLR